jgi:hypothetical protein
MDGSPTNPVRNPELGLRDAYHPLFQKYGVDLVSSMAIIIILSKDISTRLY